MSRRRGISAAASAVLARYGLNNIDVKKLPTETKNASDTLKEKVSVPKVEIKADSVAMPTPIIKPAVENSCRIHKGYALTLEQNFAADLSITGQDLKIEAFAGAGKTSTLSAIAVALAPKKGLYIAFNKSIATDAAKHFPRNVECRTAHSLAFAAVGIQYKHKLGKKLNGEYIAKNILTLKSEFEGFSPAAVGNLVLNTVNRFTQSGNFSFHTDNLPWADLMKIESKRTREIVGQYVLDQASKLWTMMIDVKSNVPITHDTYLKIWSMNSPIIRKDFILFDEAQDASPVMLHLVNQQKCQKIYVGDRYQQIYSWRGAVNAMKEIKTKHTCTITQSFRFGQAIADLANEILNTELHANVNIRGFEKVKSEICNVRSPEAILCRTNAALISTLISRLGMGERVSVVGGCEDTIALLKAVKDLKNKGNTTHRELCLFESWGALVLFSESGAGTDLASLVKLVEAHDIDDLISTLEETRGVDESHCDIILSTVHKAKGREWESVALAYDFRKPDSRGYSNEETNLLYVAITRAINFLDITDCEAAQQYRK